MTAYDEGFISFFLGVALEQNPYTRLMRQRRRNLYPVQRRMLDDHTGEMIDWEKGWKKASEYSKNNRYPTDAEEMHLN